ncbi:MbnP family protein [Hymenobacter negativus]|uniref:Copper-binding protein MbnP-like domain-containing protein n=1 Tax=Hymenobacter negativus TaxID=2795026 RepID=A0ABS3QHV6_9BACT|nr:MbnP family protein [Hymenobacter negativus]MBO2010829.1 hypothetical protein [Hymenobacter negativus]
MKRFSIPAFASSLALAALFLSGCSKEDEAVPATTGTVALEFDQMVGTAPLVLSTQTYTTTGGDQFRVSTFRQYISNIKLTRADGSQYTQPDSYHLLDAAVPESLEITLTDVPTGDYTGISFTIGVDSARNVSGAQKGALDPSNGMFWTWNSGYIYTKLEGYSPQAPKPAGVAEGGLTFHVGGFKTPSNAIRTVSPAFPSGTKLLVRADHSPEIHLKADILKMFAGTTPVRFSSLSFIMSAGPNAVLVANNYAQGMFTVDHIHAN